MAIFRTVNGSRPIFMLSAQHSRSNNLMITKDGKRRELRYCDNEPTIWADEQNTKSRPTTIIFRDGKLKVDEESNPTLFEFLKADPRNGKVFIEVDEKEEAKRENKLMIDRTKAGMAIMEASDDKIKSVILNIIPSLATASTEIQKQRLFDIAQKSPNDIITLFASHKTDNTGFASELITNLIVVETKDKKGLALADTEEVFIEKHHMKGAEKALAEWLDTDGSDEMKGLLKTKLKGKAMAER